MAAVLPRLVRVSAFQQTPMACLAALRARHPRLELVCLLPGVWWIGEVKPSTAARLAGQAQLRRLRDRMQAGAPVRQLSFWKATLQAQGFRLLALVNCPLPTPSVVVHAVLPALVATPRQVEATLDAGERAASGVDKREASSKWLREDYARHAGRDAYRHAFHRPIHSLPAAPTAPAPSPLSGVSP